MALKEMMKQIWLQTQMRLFQLQFHCCLQLSVSWGGEVGSVLLPKCIKIYFQNNSKEKELNVLNRLALEHWVAVTLFRAFPNVATRWPGLTDCIRPLWGSAGRFFQQPAFFPLCRLSCLRFRPPNEILFLLSGHYAPDYQHKYNRPPTRGRNGTDGIK